MNKNKGIKLVFVQKITFFQQKLLPPELHFLTSICTKSFLGWGFAPDPWGAYSAPDPLAVFRGPTSKGMGGRRGDVREWERRDGEDRKGEKGRAEERTGGEKGRGSSSFAVRRKKRKVGAYVLELYVNHSPYP